MIRLGDFERDLARMRKDVKNLSSATKIMRESLQTWLGKDGLLNKRQADNLVLEIQGTLWAQDFPGADVPLHPFTMHMRERHNIQSKKVGVATGTSLQAFQSIHEGNGNYSVGIPNEERHTEGGGKLSSVRLTMWRFEVGYRSKEINPRGSKSKESRDIVSKPVHEQPARPFFWPTVRRFISTNLEKNARDTIYEAFTTGLRRWQRYGGAQYGEGLTVQDFVHQARGFYGD